MYLRYHSNYSNTCIVAISLLLLKSIGSSYSMRRGSIFRGAAGWVEGAGRGGGRNRVGSIDLVAHHARFFGHVV